MRSERRYGLIEAELQGRKRIDLVFAAGQGATGVISEVDRLDVQLRAVLNDDLARVGERLRRDVQGPGRRGRVDRPAIDNSVAGVVVPGQVTGAGNMIDVGVGAESQDSAAAGIGVADGARPDIDRPVVEGVVAGED